MPGSFFGFDLAARALRGFQRGLDVTGHNIANVNTRGYSRQTVDFTQTEPLTFYANGLQSLGTGVTIGSVNRIRDQFLESRMQDAQAELGKFGQLAASLKEIQGIYNEPGSSGISSALDKFFDSWSALASNPAEAANRLQVRLAGENLAGRIRGAYADLGNSQSNLTIEIGQTTSRISELGQTIDRLNKQIRALGVGGATPNDLLDQRNLALEELSSLVNVTTSAGKDGTISVYISQFTLVDGAGSNELPRTFDAATGMITDGSRGYQIRSGRLAGLFQSLNQANASMAQLDTLANTLRTQVNGLHTTGINPKGTTGIRFFNDAAAPPQTGAIDFGLSAEVLADVDNISAGTSGKAGDGGLALSLSNLRSQSIAALGNKTFSLFHSSHVATIGSDLAYYGNTVTTQEAIVEQIDAQRQSISGVSLDDEMTNMLRFQRSYQAAAKVLTIFDQVTEDLLGMVRR